MNSSAKKSDKNKKESLLVAITGASSGIGYELAKVFAKKGHDLIVCAEDPGIVEAAQVFKSFGVEVQSVQADLTKYDDVEKFYGMIQSKSRPLDVVVLNAGVGVGGEFLNTSLEREIEMIQLNITSLVHLTKRVLPDFVERGEGKILFTSSIAAEMPGPYYAVYAATKAFVQSFSEAIRSEVKDKGVTVTALQPGATDTNFFARADMENTKAGKGKKDSAADVAEDGYNALMAGKDHVIAGSIMNKIQKGVASVLTQPQGAAMQGSSTKPGSGSDH